MMTPTTQLHRIDLFWIIALMIVGGLFSLLISNTLFDLSVSLSGILCVGLIAIGRREGYLVGLYNSASYALLSYQNGLFGEMYLNILFFIPSSLVGYFLWQRHQDQNHTVVMQQLPKSWRWSILVGCGLATLGLGWILQLNPQQNTPYLDATTNVLSIVATLLMMGRYQEQWLLYIILNGVTIMMWILRTMVGGEASDLMVLMWSLFLINALFGYWRWHQGAQPERGVAASVLRSPV